MSRFKQPSKTFGNLSDSAFAFEFGKVGHCPFKEPHDWSRNESS
jgi:hypothetical protein